MKYFNCKESPIRVYGLPHIYQTGKFWRMPQEIIEKMDSKLENLFKRNMGGRVRFKTNSENVTVIMKLETLSVDICIPIVGSAGANVFTGTGVNAKYLGYVSPLQYTEEAKECKASFKKQNIMEDITIFLPRNERVESLEIGIDENAVLEAPTPYTYEKPIVFYGSSITEGGCASRVGNAYTSLLSRWLDSDMINYGFSGSARGEQTMANYLSTLEMSIFVMDYDHNSPPDELRANHKPFFDIIRKAQPNLPIVFMSRPDFDYVVEEAAEKRNTILYTYKTAVSQGDKNVYFIDGEKHFGQGDRFACTVDTVHPNDLGFMRMAENIYPTLRKILEGA